MDNPLRFHYWMILQVATGTRRGRRGSVRHWKCRARRRAGSQVAVGWEGLNIANWLIEIKNFESTFVDWLMVLSIYSLFLTVFNLSWHDSPNGLILFEMPWNHHQHLWWPWSKPKFQLRSTHSHHIHCFVDASTPSFGWFVPILHSETTIFPRWQWERSSKKYSIIPYSSSTNFGRIIP